MQERFIFQRNFANYRFNPPPLLPKGRFGPCIFCRKIVLLILGMDISTMTIGHKLFLDGILILIVGIGKIYDKNQVPLQ